MAEQTPKLGLDMMHVDPDLELRLRNIERQLTLKSVANPDSDETQIVAGSDIAAPTGLKLVNGVEEIQVTWDAAPIGNLKHYEVQNDTDSGFSDPTITKTQQTLQNFTSLTAETTYYVRVRAVNTDGDAGAWTGSLNTTTAQVVNADLADRAVSTGKVQLEATAKLSTGSAAGPISLTTTAWKELVTLTVTKDDGTDSNLVIWFGTDLENKSGGSANAEVVMRLHRDDTTVVVALGVTSKGIHVHNDRETIVASAAIETGLAAGSYQYDVDAALVTGSPNVDCNFNFIIVEEVKV
jgi:hypothetical protein